MQRLNVDSDLCSLRDGHLRLEFVLEPLVGLNLFQAVAEVRIRHQDILNEVFDFV